MPATEQQYAEAWCTQLLREQQEANECMRKLLQYQQKTINELHQKSGGNSQQSSALGSRYDSEHLFGPTSTPIVWSGTTKDLVPVSVDEKGHKALIMTNEFIKILNEAFASSTAMQMVERQASEEALYREHLLGLTEIAAGVYQGGLTDDQCEKLHSESNLRNNMFTDMGKKELEVYNQAYDFLERFMRNTFRKNGLRREGNYQESKQAIQESKIALLGGIFGMRIS
ncbi:hypothetical protein ACEPPN_016268 [Leptodophora sp. 'Broadleaf-Isolate-01']